MKRAKSILIDQFLTNIRSQYVVGRENTSGPVILGLIERAFRDILSGVHPDTALKIERQSGKPKAEQNLMAALIMRSHEKAGTKSTAAEKAANEWLAANGYKELTGKRLRDILEQYRPDVEQIEIMSELYRRISAVKSQNREQE